MSHRVKLKNGKLLPKEERLSLKEKAQLSIIHASMKGMNEKQLWELYGVLSNSENDKYKPLMFKMLDTEFIKRNIQHDFSKDYKKD